MFNIAVDAATLKSLIETADRRIADLQSEIDGLRANRDQWEHTLMRAAAGLKDEDVRSAIGEAPSARLRRGMAAQLIPNLLLESPHGLTIDEIREKIDASTSTIWRVLTKLHQDKQVSQLDNGKWQLILDP
jgi:uncharacterized small protein (DUF1192 family)